MRSIPWRILSPSSQSSGTMSASNSSSEKGRAGAVVERAPGNQLLGEAFAIAQPGAGSRRWVLAHVAVGDFGVYTSRARSLAQASSVNLLDGAVGAARLGLDADDWPTMLLTGAECRGPGRDCVPETAPGHGNGRRRLTSWSGSGCRGGFCAACWAWRLRNAPVRCASGRGARRMRSRRRDEFVDDIHASVHSGWNHFADAGALAPADSAGDLRSTPANRRGFGQVFHAEQAFAPNLTVLPSSTAVRRRGIWKRAYRWRWTYGRQDSEGLSGVPGKGPKFEGGL